MLKTKPSSRNSAQVFNMYVISVFTYSFRVKSWPQTEIQSLQRSMQTKMTSYQMNHRRSSVERERVSSVDGGRS